MPLISARLPLRGSRHRIVSTEVCAVAAFSERTAKQGQTYKEANGAPGKTYIRISILIAFSSDCIVACASILRPLELHCLDFENTQTIEGVFYRLCFHAII